MVCVRGRNRPRRCPPRPRLKVPPELKSTSHLYPQQRCGPNRVWEPVSVRDRPWQFDSARRSTTTVWDFSLLFWERGFSSCSGLAFPVPWWALSCSCSACVGFAAKVGPGAGVGPVGPFCGSVFQSGCRSWRFFPGWAFDLARHTGESEGRSLRQLATRQNERRRSSELSVHHMGSQSSAKVRRTQDLHAERSSNGSCALLRAESSSNGSPPLLGCSCDP